MWTCKVLLPDGWHSVRWEEGKELTTNVADVELDGYKGFRLMIDQIVAIGPTTKE